MDEKKIYKELTKILNDLGIELSGFNNHKLEANKNIQTDCDKYVLQLQLKALKITLEEQIKYWDGFSNNKENITKIAETINLMNYINIILSKIN